MRWRPCSAPAGAPAWRAAEAIAEAFDDLRMHELATVSAMQAAVRVLLAQFEPEAVERKVERQCLADSSGAEEGAGLGRFRAAAQGA